MKLQSKTFDETRPINFPRGKFDMSHTHQGSYDMGYFYPIFCEEVMPSDKWDLSQALSLTMMPTVSAVKTQLDVQIHYWMVPYSCLMDIVSGEKAAEKDETSDPSDYPYQNAQWWKFYTGGFTGSDTQILSAHTPNADDMEPGSLWDHLGLPMNIPNGNWAANKIWKAPFAAYQTIWNHNYRDETTQPPISLWSPTEKYKIRRSNWEKDYFTIAQKTQQRGIAPAIPVEGTANALFNSIAKIVAQSTPTRFAQAAGGITDDLQLNTILSGAATPLIADPTALEDNSIDIEGLAIASDQLRLQFATQRFMERNQRDGVRPSEFLRAHFDDGPKDEHMDLPYYIGGYRQTINLNEVIQVSETGTTPQGTRAGIGAANGGGHVGTYHVKEPGLIMGIMRIQPRAMYTQGTRKEWFDTRTRFDFPFPEFANLSEQPVMGRELYSDDTSQNDSVFGYIGRYDEYRQRRNMAVGLMRQTVDGLTSWNLARNFSSAPALNSDFLAIEAEALKERIFVVTDEPGFIVTLGNICTADRPIPYVAQPGLLDHV